MGAVKETIHFMEDKTAPVSDRFAWVHSLIVLITVMVGIPFLILAVLFLGVAVIMLPVSLIMRWM